MTGIKEMHLLLLGVGGAKAVSFNLQTGNIQKNRVVHTMHGPWPWHGWLPAIPVHPAWVNEVLDEGEAPTGSD